jgi:oligoribonuclease
MKLYWLDLETTGLNPAVHQILEVGVSIADFDTPFEATPIYHAVLTFAFRDLQKLDPFIIDMHGNNGLLAECFQPAAKDVLKAEYELLDLIPPGITKEEMPILAGASIHFDREFLNLYMPMLASRFSHRHYDVSAIKLFCQSLGMPKLPKGESHRVKEDILETIQHAKTCRDWLANGLVVKPDPPKERGRKVPGGGINYRACTESTTLVDSTYVCTMTLGHEGDHESWDYNDSGGPPHKPKARWPQVTK